MVRTSLGTTLRSGSSAPNALQKEQATAQKWAIIAACRNSIALNSRSCCWDPCQKFRAPKFANRSGEKGIFACLLTTAPRGTRTREKGTRTTPRMHFQSQGSPPAGCHGGGRAGGKGSDRVAACRRWQMGSFTPSSAGGGLLGNGTRGKAGGLLKTQIGWNPSGGSGGPQASIRPLQGSSAKKVVSCRVRFRFNPCKNQLRSTRGDLVRALLEVSEGFCYCNQTPNVPIPFCWESEVIYTLLNILRRSQELPSLCIPYICFCSSLRHHAAGNSSGGYRSGLGKKHSLYHPEITQSCPRQGLALCLSAYTAVFHPAPFVLCIWLCFSCATPTQEAEVKARSRAPEHSSAFLERGRTHLLRIPTGRHSHKLWRADAPCTPLHCWGMLQ